jgi:hypothetical protein
MLNSFAESTSLHVNYHKYNIYPINMSSQMELLANTFQCQIRTLLFTYLGMSIGLNKPNMEAFFLLIQKMERRLASTSHFLFQVSRLQMVNTIFLSLPTYYMYTLRIPKSVIKQIDKYRRHCLWRSANINAKKPPQEAWNLVREPKKQDGLRVPHIETQNKALLMKNMHKLFNRLDILWVKLYGIITQ